MKTILGNIIKNYVNFSYDLINNGTLLIIKNESWEESDFFYFIFTDDLDEFNSEKIYNGLLENNKELLKIESFDKNLNFIIFNKIDKYEDMYDNNNSSSAYLIEENPLYAKKKVIFYTDNLVSNFVDLDIKDIDKIDDNLTENNKFKINLLIWLSFIKVDFWNKDWILKDIFNETYEDFKKYIDDDDIKILENNIFINEDFNIFNSKINEMDYNSMIADVEKNSIWISSFEEILLNLFENWDDIKESLKINLLKLQKLENENKENWNI